MKYTLTITDESGKIGSYNIETGEPGEKKNLNDFIIKSLQIAESKRKIPLITQCPNGLEVFPSLKMKFKNYGSPLLGDDIEAMLVTWQD